MHRTLSLLILLVTLSTSTVLAQSDPAAVNAIAGRGDVQALRAALAEGSDPNGIGAAYAIILSDESTPLLEAIRGRHLQAVEILLEAGANPFEPDEDGRMPMWYAADAGSLEITRLLLDFDADIEEGGSTTSPLMHAASRDHVDLVRFLLDAGANLSAQDGNNNSVLGKAVSPYSKSFGNARSVMLLIERGAALSIPNVRGFTPLHMAIHTSPSSLLLAHLLLEAGADTTLPNADGKTPADLAAERGTPMLQAYFRGESAAQTQAEFLAAVARNDAEAVRATVAAGADPDWSGTLSQDGTALHAAAAWGYTDLIAVLVEVGATVDIADDQGFTPLYRAAERGDLATVRALLSAGASPDGLAEWSFLGLEPIHFAALSGDAEVVQALLDAGANPRWTTSATMGDGYNALGFAIRGGHLDVVRVLLDAGVDPNALGETQVMPLDLAEEKGWTAIASILRERGAQSGTEAAEAYIQESLDEGATLDELFIEAAASDDLRLMQALIDRSAVPPSSALSAAASPAIVQRLLTAGADITARTDSGNTVLVDAIGLASAETVWTLIDAGADFDTPDSNGQTPVHLAIAFDRGDVLELLLDAGADVNARDNDGKTPLQIAQEYQMEDYIEWLREAGATE